jgi:hypothetical protein
MVIIIIFLFWCSSSQDCWVLCLLRMQYYTVLSLGCLILPLQCTETCQKYPVTVIFYYIFHIKPRYISYRYITIIFQNIPNSILVRFWWNFYQQNVRSENYVIFKTTFFKNIIPKSTLVRFRWFFYQQKQN